MSSAVIHNGMVYTAGVVASDSTADVTGQTEQILKEIDRLLAEAGSEKTRIIKVNIWLRDISQFAAMNVAWDAWVPQGHTPARATVEAKLADPALLVEIMVEAAI
jgi:enamine deaminase RidA (YjgF/YER057c/UK114 family)